MRVVKLAWLKNILANGSLDSRGPCLSGECKFCCGGLMGWEKSSFCYLGKYTSNNIKEPMDATQYMHILYTDTHVCKWYIHELKPTLYMCHYMPFQASYLSRFFGSYLRGLGWWHCAKVFPPVLWSLELSNASHGDKTYPSDTGMEIGLCSGSKSVSLSWYHVVSNILTCNAIELGTTLYIWYMQSIFGAFVSLHIF